MFFLSLIVLSGFFESARSKISQSCELTFDDIINEEPTPLDFSTKRMRDFFATSKISTLETKALRAVDMKEYFNRSFLGFIKNVYNEHTYGRALSQDGTHIVEFLELGNELKLDTNTTYVGLRLFYNKIKSQECEIIDDSVIQQIIRPMPNLLTRYFTQETQKKEMLDLTFLRKHTEELLLSQFTKHYEIFQEEPGHFLAKISDNITETIKKELEQTQKSQNQIQEEFEMRERLRQTIVKFLEIALTKTIWNIKTPEGIWNSFLSIANHIQMLGVNGVINHMDDLDDLHWSLTHAFTRNLELFGAYLPIEFYDEVESDLTHEIVYFLETPEQDEGIKTKKEIIIDALVNAKAKAVGYSQQGILPSHTI